MLRWLTAGESHGPALVAVLEGLPAGVRTTTADVADALARRRAGYGRGARMSFERDEVEFLGGIRHGVSMGGPVAVRIGNSEWPKWEQVMSADPVDEAELAALARNAPLTRPRPGHADLVGMQKYALTDVRPILERSSARETAARVALGDIASAFLRQTLDVEVLSHVVSIGSVCVPVGLVPAAGRSRRHRRRPGALLRPGHQCGDGRRDRRRPQRRRHPRRRRRSRRPRPAAGSRQSRALGSPTRFAACRRAHGHPGDQGRRNRRRIRVGPPTRLGCARRDRKLGRPACGGARIGPAAPRAACRPASRCVRAPR